MRVRYDNEPAMVQLINKVVEFRMPRNTIKEPIARGEREAVGAAERAHRSLQANARAQKLDFKARAGVDVIPGHVLFPWMLRHTAWLADRFQQRGPKAVAAYEVKNGAPYKSTLVNFGEVVISGTEAQGGHAVDEGRLGRPCGRE